MKKSLINRSPKLMSRADNLEGDGVGISNVLPMPSSKPLNRDALKTMDENFIIEVDTALIDRSATRDRLQIEHDDIESLAISIEAEGQVTPILLRPHPNVDSGYKYQTIYGHRRVLACASLHRTVRAVVREISDEQALIAQGLENLERLNLSFIEKALFATAMLEQGYERQTIMRAMSVQNPMISRFTSITRDIPSDLIKAIGKANGISESQWLGLADMLYNHDITEEQVQDIINRLYSGDWSDLTSDERFAAVRDHIKNLVYGPEESDATNAPAPDSKQARPIGPPVTVSKFMVNSLPVQFKASKGMLNFKINVKDRPDLEANALRIIKTALELAMEEFDSKSAPDAQVITAGLGTAGDKADQ